MKPHIDREVLKRFLRSVTFGFEMEMVFKELAEYPCKVNSAAVMRVMAGEATSAPCRDKHGTILRNVDEDIVDAFIEKVSEIGESMRNVVSREISGARFYGGIYHSGEEQQYVGSKTFRFETDITVGLNGVEFVTPPFYYTDAIKHIPKIVQGFRKLGARTDNRHGWHIHISEQDENKYKRAVELFTDIKFDLYPRGKYKLYWIALLAKVLGSFSFDIASPDRKFYRYSHSFHNRLSKLSIWVDMEDFGQYILDNLEIEDQEKLEGQVLVDVEIALPLVLSGQTKEFNYAIGFDGLVNYFNEMFDAVVKNEHVVEITLVQKHNGVENRAIGGIRAMKVFADPRKFKQLLIDTIWKYYVMFNFEEIDRKHGIETIASYIENEFPKLVKNAKIDGTFKNEKYEILVKNISFGTKEAHKIKLISKEFSKTIEIRRD